jgi:hypothetical protein
MNEEAEAKAIEEWLRMVDKPLETKKETKRKRSRKLSERTKTVNSPAAVGGEELKKAGIKSVGEVQVAIPADVSDATKEPIANATKYIDHAQNYEEMDEETETKAIEKWLRLVDKPLATKEGDKKDAKPRDK